MSNYKNNHQSSFSFQHNLKIQSNRSTFIMTSTQKQGLIGWLSSVLEPHDDEFMRALQGSHRLGVIGLFRYMNRNYSHLKQIVQYYIIAKLIDYQWTSLTLQDSSPLEQSNDMMLNLLIQHLAARFYCESQWMTKIMHIPFYQIFNMFDQFSKGYITIRQLSRFCNIIQKPKDSQKMRLLNMKLKSNLGGFQQRIYQQNFKQLQFRVDFISFNQQNFKNFTDCSEIYSQIFSLIEYHVNILHKTRYHAQCKQQADKRQALQRIDINRENFNIKQFSKKMVQPKDTQLFTQNKKDNACKSLGMSDTRIQQSKLNILADSQELPSPVYMPLNDIIVEKQQPKKDAFLPQNKDKKQKIEIFNHSQQYMINIDKENRRIQCIEGRQKTLLKAAILNELQNIKFLKYHNRSNLIAYL